MCNFVKRDLWILSLSIFCLRHAIGALDVLKNQSSPTSIVVSVMLLCTTFIASCHPIITYHWNVLKVMFLSQLVMLLPPVAIRCCLWIHRQGDSCWESCGPLAIPLLSNGVGIHTNRVGIVSKGLTPGKWILITVLSNLCHHW